MSRQPDPDDTAIGERLRQARTAARLTQADAAKALGIPRSAVPDLEAGTRHLTAVELAKCAAVYRRPVGWFLGDHPGPDQPTAALARLIGSLHCSDRDTVTRFAEFLAERPGAARQLRLGG